MNYKVNKTTLFLMPLLEIKHCDLFGLINCYIKSEHTTALTKKYTLLMMFDPKIATYSTLSSILNYPYPSSQTITKSAVVVSIELPVILHRVYDLWLAGKYSMFTDDQKNTILAFWLKDTFAIHNVRKETRLYKMLYPTDVDRNAISKALDTTEPILEVVSKPCILEETFLYSDIYNLVK